MDENTKKEKKYQDGNYFNCHKVQWNYLLLNIHINFI